MERIPMLGVTLIQDFLSTPPPCFDVQLGIDDPTIKHDRSQITVCVDSLKYKKWFPDTMGRVLKVTSVAEYETLVQDIISKPLFLNLSLERLSAPAFESYTQNTKVDMFVTVNTSNPVIKSQLLDVLEEGRTDIKSGRKFCLEISFNKVLKDWFCSILRSDDGILSCLNTIAFADHASIVITNTTEFFEPYRCNWSILVCLIFCLPCCLLSCPFYRTCRFLTTTDRKSAIQGEIQYLNWVDGVPHAQRSFQFILQREVRSRGISSGGTDAV